MGGLAIDSTASCCIAWDENGIYRSTDGAESWTQVADQCCMEIECCPGDPSKLAAVTLGGSVLGSIDGGETWFDNTADPPGYPMELAFCGMTIISTDAASTVQKVLVSRQQPARPSRRPFPSAWRGGRPLRAAAPSPPP